MTTLKRWATDVLAGGAVAALGLALLVGGGTLATANVITPVPIEEGLTCEGNGTGGCKSPNAECTMDNGNKGTCQSSQNCPCKQ